MVQCQVCNKDFNRADFANHECLKDMFISRIRNHEFDVMDYIAENLMMMRRQKENLGLCKNRDCVQKFKESGAIKENVGMIVPSNSNNPVKCARCNVVVAAFEDQFSCIYCH